MTATAKSVRRLALDISPLMAGYLLFQAALGLFLDFVWISHPAGNPMLLPGVLLALNGSLVASKVPVWRMLPVSAREIDRARWWHSVGAPGLVLALMFAVSVLILTVTGSVRAPCQLARYRPVLGRTVRLLRHHGPGVDGDAAGAAQMGPLERVGADSVAIDLFPPGGAGAWRSTARAGNRHSHRDPGRDHSVSDGGALALAPDHRHVGGAVRA
jgi:hypothetical protein